MFAVAAAAKPISTRKFQVVNGGNRGQGICLLLQSIYIFLHE
jgi:hypothetical protein